MGCPVSARGHQYNTCTGGASQATRAWASCKAGSIPACHPNAWLIVPTAHTSPFNTTMPHLPSTHMAGSMAQVVYKKLDSKAIAGADTLPLAKHTTPAQPNCSCIHCLYCAMNFATKASKWKMGFCPSHSLCS